MSYLLVRICHSVSWHFSSWNCETHLARFCWRWSFILISLWYCKDVRHSRKTTQLSYRGLLCSQLYLDGKGLGNEGVCWQYHFIVPNVLFTYLRRISTKDFLMASVVTPKALLAVKSKQIFAHRGYRIQVGRAWAEETPPPSLWTEIQRWTRTSLHQLADSCHECLKLQLWHIAE